MLTPVDREVKAWMHHALDLAQNSPDTSVQNAAVIVGEYPGVFIEDGHGGARVMQTVRGKGVNTFTTGVAYSDERMQRPQKYMWIEHAERNAIYDAARGDKSLLGTTMFCPWAACADCARAIVQSGIKTLYRLPMGNHDGWTDSIAVGEEILRFGQVDVIELDMEDFQIPDGLRLGQFRDG